MTIIEAADYTLHLGDCLDVMATMPDASIDLTVTSPPYDNLRTYGKDFDPNKFDWRPIIKELYRITKPGGVVVWVVADATINGSETGTSFRQALWAMNCGFNNETMIYLKNGLGAAGPNYLYWQYSEFMFLWMKEKPCCTNLICDKPAKKPGMKNTAAPRGRNGYNKNKSRKITNNLMIRRSNVWKYSVGKGSLTKDEFNHPAPFPEALANDHIISWSNPGDVVFDPMMGSGTTGKMAILNDRKFIGVELDAGYFAIAEKRIHEAANPLQPALMEAAD